MAGLKFDRLPHWMPRFYFGVPPPIPLTITVENDDGTTNHTFKITKWWGVVGPGYFIGVEMYR